MNWKSGKVLSLDSTLLAVLNIVKFKHIIDYGLCFRISRTPLDVCIKDSDQMFMSRRV